MSLDNYEELEVYREVNGWNCALALDRERQQSVAVNRLHLDSSVSQEAIQEYQECLQRLRDDPHPNLLTVLETGIDNDQLIVITEWLEAEDLSARKDQGMSFDQIVAMSNAMASALQHLHSHGIVHRTISPETVLFESETQSVRLDVPLWNLDSEESAPPHDQAYYAPEVLTGQQHSTASDIYAVGILLYSTIVGNFPWTDQNGVPRIRAEDDAVPRLPLSQSSLQQAIEDMLAFSPSARTFSYENTFDRGGDEVTDATMVSDVRYRSGTIDVSEIQRVARPLDRPVSSSSESPTKKSRFWLYSTVMIVAVFGVLASVFAYINFDGVRMLFYEIGIVDHPELSERWREAESLRLEKKHSLITVIAAYNKVLELDPRHNGAHQAIADEKRQLRETIDSWIKADEFAKAQARLDEYVAAVPNDDEIASLFSELENRQKRDRLLVDARPLVAAGVEDLASLHAAVLTYKTVLRLFPDSEEARRQLHDIAVMYTKAAIEAANASETQAARNFFEKAQEADPDAQELEEARESVELAESLETDINTTLQQANAFFEDGRLITPPDEDNAMSTYRQVLALDPDNERARSQLVEIEKQLIEQHRELLVEREFGAEANVVRSAERAGVSEATLQAMTDARESLQQDIQEAVELYREAQSLFQRGYISEPESDNAIAVLRRAQAKDAQNSEVSALLDQCAERTATVAQEAFRAGLVDRAKQYIGLALEIQPMNDLWSRQYQQWMQLD
ncbi:MAG: protein kinase [Gammaproteobacteria bacterium]|nr:protein kinase [Gammaproteobacteria bacterium]MYF01806.1 protein kinase [Gammaproteobacteria bacterium]MYI76446.1 protein kinase [Gammaproteobacteria bacterium]